MIKKRGSVISATLWIIIINAVVFFATYFFASAIVYLAVQPSSILQGKYLWTLFTAMFMHANVFHLAVNMFSLMFIGSFTEKLIGKKRFVLFYLLSGIFASIFFVLASLIFTADMNSMAVGASGAIFAIGGLLAVLTPKMKVYIFFIPIAMPLWFGITLSLALMWVLSAVSGLPIGNTAHLGGLLAGLAYGFFLRIKHKKKIQRLDNYFSKN